MKRLRRFLPLLLLLLASPLSAANDPRAEKIGRAMIDAMGGNAAWEHARWFRFDFTVVRDGKKVASFSHWWDRWTGRYRVEGEDAGGVPWKAYINVNTKDGDYWVNGAKTEGDTRAKGLERAYGRFINDSYWLLAPWKIFDPGVTLDYVGEVAGTAGNPCDEIRLSFSGVGLTPKDVYWMDVDRSTHRLDRWKFVLNGGNDPPTAVAWKDWRKLGGIELSLSKPFVDKPAEIRFENVQVSENVDEGALTPPR
ncbi:MAG TPA: hypothetical protein VFS34_07320 [Thermoanaerobaculia bacterium]|nr:hypothetical protein [Thermoanaerobaculia bacterium]